MMYEIIIVLILMWFILSFAGMSLWADLNLSIFNPIRNYNTWTNLNWFGIGFVTILLNLIALPMAILYWIYKIVELLCNFTYLLFTVGRK